MYSLHHRFPEVKASVLVLSIYQTNMHFLLPIFLTAAVLSTLAPEIIKRRKGNKLQGDL
jgi:hypothetical protein